MTQNIGSLAVSLSLDASNFNGSVEQVNRNLGAMASELKASKALGVDYGKSVEGLTSKKDILSRSVEASSAKLKIERQRYDELAASGKANEIELERQAKRVNEAQAQYNRLSTELASVDKALRIQSSSWTQYGEKMETVGTKMKSIGQGMTDVGSNLTKKVTLPIVGLGTAAFKAAVDFESAFAGVRKTVNMSEAEFAILSDGIRNMAKEIPAAATEIAGVAEAAGQLGIKNDAILGFTRTMVDLGVATNMSSEQAATALARLANITNMNQQDFDKLGSSVVALGNNFAATEGEIVEMALRLAGAGAQIGMSEADILGLAAALSSVGIEAEMGGSAMSRVMVRMQVAATTGLGKVIDLSKKTGMSLRDMQLMASNDGKGFKELAQSLNMTQGEMKNIINAGVDLENFAKIAGMTGEEFKKAFEKDAVGALGAFVNGLGSAEEAGDSAINMLEEMGITEIRLRDSLLRAGNASELFADAIGISNDAWEENIALTDEAEERYKTTESQLKILWNRVKDVGITLGDALIPALMSAIDAAEPLIRQIESGAKAFADMDEEQQQTILKMIALVAAVGPASVALGGLTTSVGGVVSIGGKLMSTLGKTGGAGLIGRIGLMGPAAATPVGLAIAGVGALAYGIYAFNEASKESAQDALKFVEARKKELDSMDELIAAFELLKLKNKLSTDEMLRYLDISSEIKNAKTEEAIQALTEEQQKLFEKSGLTNEEMERFLEMNEKLVEEAPSTAKAISEQGNAYAAVTDELKKLNAEERERLVDKTYRALTDEMSKQEKILEKQRKINEEIKDREESRSKQLGFISADTDRIREINLKIAELKERANTATGAELKELEKKIKEEERSKSAIESSVKMSESIVDNITKQINKKKESLAKTDEELAAFGKLIDEYEEMILYQAGLTSERGKGIDKLREEQQNIDAARKKLEEMRASGVLVGDAYDEQNKKLNDQQGKISDAIKKLGEMNVIAGQTVYKEINVKTNPNLDNLNRDLSNPITKRVNIQVHGATPIEAYAKGTSFHKGGPALVGEEGFELAKIGSKWSILDFGITNLPRGAQVFTHEESKKILQALSGATKNNLLNKLGIPAYASGISPPGEATRVINDLSSKAININIVSQLSGVISTSKNVGKELMDSVGKVLKDGAKKINEDVNKIEKEAAAERAAIHTKAAEDIAIAYSNGFDTTRAANEKAITGVAKVLSAATRKNAEEVSAIAVEAEKKRIEIQNEYAKKRADLNLKTTQSSQSALKTHKNKKGEIVRTGEQKARNIRQDASAKLIKLNEEEQKKLTSISEKAAADIVKKESALSKERLEAVKTYVADKKSLDEMSLVAESEVWRKSLALFNEGTKERVEIQKNYQAALKAINDDVTKTNEEYAGKMEKINDDLRKQEDDLTKEYEKTLSDRTKALINFSNTFDFFEVKLDKSSEDLMANLRSQVFAFERWQQEIDEISKKAIDKGLIEELKAMGPKALPELIMLNNMTDKQLSEYSDLYAKKSKLAREQAEKELVGMKSDTEKRIKDLRTAANNELEALRGEWVKKIESITKATDGELMSLQQIGVNAGRGLLDGLASMEGSLIAKARSIANSISATMADALQVKSPSRVTMKIGKHIGEGLMVGMENMLTDIKRVAARMGDFAVPSLPDLAMGSVTGGRRAAGGQLTSTGTVVHQQVVINSPKALSPSETARLNKRAAEELALAWR